MKLAIERYRETINKLPIFNPTPEDISALAPHLPFEDAEEILEKSKTKYAFVPIEHWLALPPLRVLDAYQRVCLVENDGQSLIISGIPKRLGWLKPGPPNTEHFVQEAVDFARQNWADQLVQDTWKNVVVIHVGDPSIADDEPEVKATVCFATNKVFRDELFTFGQSGENAARMVNQSILIAATGHDGNELIGLRERLGHGKATKDFSTFLMRNCAACGGQFSHSGCIGCGRSFPPKFVMYNSSTHGGRGDAFDSSFPLPTKLVEVLVNSGYKFEITPRRYE